ncbi:MAG: hypothetical protein ABSG75_04335 [Syntrophales bacterium]|jgi:hemerythrin-like domain-containing protein
MITPAKQLKEEHGGITLMLKILEKVCTKMETKKKGDLSQPERIMKFFKIFVDQCITGKKKTCYICPNSF